MNRDRLKQEPSGDLISREETLTAFADYVGSGMSMDDYDALWDIVAKMPAVNPTKTEKWISVSKRLPEDRREVLVTAYWHETHQVMMGSYYGDGLWWCVPFNNCGEHMQRLKPKAWMPLPKPYEPQERSDKE